MYFSKKRKKGAKRGKGANNIDFLDKVIQILDILNKYLHL